MATSSSALCVTEGTESCLVPESSSTYGVGKSRALLLTGLAHIAAPLCAGHWLPSELFARLQGCWHHSGEVCGRSGSSPCSSVAQS